MTNDSDSVIQFLQVQTRTDLRQATTFDTQDNLNQSRRIQQWFSLFGSVAFVGAWLFIALITLPKGSLVGQVIDLDGRPVVGIEVTIEGSSERTRTDTSGHFVLESVTPGQSWLHVEQPGVAGTALPFVKKQTVCLNMGQIPIFQRR